MGDVTYPAAFVLVMIDLDTMRVDGVGIFSEENITTFGNKRTLVALSGNAFTHTPAGYAYMTGVHHLAVQIIGSPRHDWIWRALSSDQRKMLKENHAKPT